MGEEEISAFLSHLAINRNVSASTQNQAFSALLFLYQQLLDRKLDFITGVERVRRPARFPSFSAKRKPALSSLISKAIMPSWPSCFTAAVFVFRKPRGCG